MKKRKLIILNLEQFGYHIDAYYHCKYLKDRYSITFVCWDFNKQKVNMEGINVIYVPRKGSFIARNVRFIITALKITKPKNALIILNYTKIISSVLRIFRFKHTFILDIRTGAIYKNHLYRLFLDTLMRFESKLFKYKTVISFQLAKKIHIHSGFYILPLGADTISPVNKTFSELNLLYVGTLYNRKIEDTIIGFSRFYHDYKETIRMRYTIIGTGIHNEEKTLRGLVEKEGLSGIVRILGEIPHWMLENYFHSHNIGVSYIPMKKYYDHQPPTKTYEYLLSGMPVIATNTSANKSIVNNSNGILVNDNPESFYRGIDSILRKGKEFDSEIIRTSVINYSWSEIVKNFKYYLYGIEKNIGC